MIREEVIKHLHEALNSVDITFPYRYVLVESIEALSRPSLPTNLDEAANDYCSAYYDWANEGERKEVVRTFEAGAEWMAGQGVSLIINDDTEWSEVDSFIHKNVSCDSIIQIKEK